jgi:hypothetical protein
LQPGRRVVTARHRAPTIDRIRRLACLLVAAVLPLAAVAAEPMADDDKPADREPVKFGGFVDFMPAYTFADPGHWSRMVGRLQLTAQGSLSENVKWKLGGRVDADPVYATSDFYPDAVKRDQRARAYWRENYLDVSAGNWDFRVGAQNIVWGEVVGLFFADVVSARDMREFLLPSFDVIRIPQWAARAEYFSGDSHVEFVWIPIPTFDQIGEPGAEFYPVALPPHTPAETLAQFHDPDRPGRSLNNSNYGVRGNTVVNGWDMAAFYYRSFSTSPTFYRHGTGAPGDPVTFDPRYDRIWQAGATVSKDFDDFVMRAEAVYAHGQGYSVNDPTVAEGVSKRNTVDFIVSLEWPLPHDTRVNIQAFNRTYSGGGAGDITVKSDGFGASAYVSTKVTSTLEPQILWIQEFGSGGGLIRPRLNWYAAKNTVASVGVDVFTGPRDGYFGRYGDRDRAYVELRYDF